MNIEDLRKETGMSQSKFANYFGISVRNIQEWEQKRKSPPPYLVGLLKRILDNEFFIKERKSAMKKWAVIENKKGDEFVTVCESKEQAIEKADYQWSYMTDHDKKHTESFIVGLINVDENGDYLELEDGIIDADVYEIAKSYK